MTAMKEHLARAIAINRGLNPDAPLSYAIDKPTWAYFVEDVDAVLERLMEPSDKMIAAGAIVDNEGSLLNAGDVWQAMIKEAAR